MHNASPIAFQQGFKLYELHFRIEFRSDFALTGVN